MPVIITWGILCTRSGMLPAASGPRRFQCNPIVKKRLPVRAVVALRPR